MTTQAVVNGVLTWVPDLVGLSLVPVVEGAPRVTQAFGVRSITGIVHRGVDLGIPEGTPVRAAATGRVTFARSDSWPWHGALPANYAGVDTSYGGYGNHVVIAHGPREDAAQVSWEISTMYAHLSRPVVDEGQLVSAGQVIGYSDSTGISTGDHLHWELRRGWDRLDPTPYIGGEADEMAEFSDAERAALHEVAEAQIHGQTFYAGSPGRALLIRLMDSFRDLELDGGEPAPKAGTLRRAQDRVLRRLAELIEALGLSREGIAALPEPKYTTLKRLLVDLQERAQEG